MKEITVKSILAKQNNNIKKGYKSRYSPIGLDIGSAVIKMIQLKQHSGKVSLHGLAYCKTPPGSFKNGLLIKPELIASSINKLLDDISWHSNKVNTSITPQACYLRRINMPQMGPAELRKAMFLEVEHNFPLPVNKAVFDYCLVNSWSDTVGGQKEYLLAAVQKDIADQYTNITEMAGLRCSSLDIVPLSLCRSLFYKYQIYPDIKLGKQENNIKDSLQLLLDIGHKTSSLLITDKGEYLFYRNIKMGVEDFFQSLVNQTNNDHHRTYKLLFERKSLTEKKLLSTADRFAAKLQQALAYWTNQTNYREGELQFLMFCGGGAFIPGLPSYLEQKLHLKRELYNPLSEIGFGDLDDFPNLYRKGSTFHLAHGLALRGWIK